MVNAAFGAAGGDATCDRRFAKPSRPRDGRPLRLYRPSAPPTVDDSRSTLQRRGEQPSPFGGSTRPQVARTRSPSRRFRAQLQLPPRRRSARQPVRPRLLHGAVGGSASARPANGATAMVHTALGNSANSVGTNCPRHSPELAFPTPPPRASTRSRSASTQTRRRPLRTRSPLAAPHRPPARTPSLSARRRLLPVRAPTAIAYRLSARCRQLLDGDRRRRQGETRQHRRRRRGSGERRRRLLSLRQHLEGARRRRHRALAQAPKPVRTERPATPPSAWPRSLPTAPRRRSASGPTRPRFRPSPAAPSPRPRATTRSPSAAAARRPLRRTRRARLRSRSGLARRLGRPTRSRSATSGRGVELGNDAIAIGTGAVATGLRSRSANALAAGNVTAIGDGTKAVGGNSTALGLSAPTAAS